MPARRSRTLNWRRGLEQIYDRRGAIEIAVARHTEGEEPGNHLVWRVQLLGLKPDELIVEEPSTLGRPIRIDNRVSLVAVMTIGQNRWSFRTECLETISFKLNAGRTCKALRLRMPAEVERCQRRNYYRMGTAALRLPVIDMWPLLDPKSVVLAERACEIDCSRAEEGMAPLTESDHEGMDLLPELGPQFTGTLVNVGGGGIGICIGPEYSQMLARHKMFWTRMHMPPEMQHPLCATAKLAHTHIQADHTMYAGMSFDFTHNPGHQKFVVDQICLFIAAQQREQLGRLGDDEAEAA